MGEMLWLGGLLAANLWLAGAGEPTPTDTTPVLPAIKPGTLLTCEHPPTPAEVLRALPRFERGIPSLCEIFRDDIEITTEKMLDRVAPPRFFPLIGPAHLHRCHWKCTVYFTETITIAYPFPIRTQRRRAEVAYIDKDHLHLVEDAKQVLQQAEVARELGRVGTTETPLGGAVGALVGGAVGNPPHSAITLDDVATMAKLGIAEDIIVRQLEIENARFDVTAADMIRLHQAGASARVLRVLQERRTSFEPSTLILTGGIPLSQPSRLPNQMSLAEIVRLKEIGTPDESIVSLIEVTRSQFRLSAEDIAFLGRHGVSSTVLKAMQAP